MSSDVDLVTTDRLICERLSLEHGDELAPIMFDPRILEWLWPEPDPPSQEDFQEGLAADVAHWEHHGFGLWFLRDRRTGAPAGRGGLRWTDATGLLEVEAAWLIVPQRWGEGLATELAQAAVTVGFERLDLSELMAYTLPENAASRRVMEKAKFSYEREIVVDELPHVLYRRLR